MRTAVKFPAEFLPGCAVEAVGTDGFADGEVEIRAEGQGFAGDGERGHAHIRDLTLLALVLDHVHVEVEFAVRAAFDGDVAVEFSEGSETAGVSGLEMAQVECDFTPAQWSPAFLGEGVACGPESVGLGGFQPQLAGMFGQ